MERVLTYIELKSKEEKEKALKFMKKTVSAKGQERRRFEVETVYYFGKLSAYAEIRDMILQDRKVKEELKQLIEKAAETALIKEKLAVLHAIKTHTEHKTDLRSFEQGVEEFKFELFKALNLLDDVTIINVK